MASKFAWQYNTETSAYANYTAHFNPNASDPCMRDTNYLGAPPDFSGTAYVAIGPISNFSSLFQSCCPNKTANAIQNYGGDMNRGNFADPPKECYYYCTFNGTYRDVDAAMNCTKQKAEDNGDHDRLIWAATPDYPGESGGVRVGAKVGAWKWAVLGLMVAGAASL